VVAIEQIRTQAPAETPSAPAPKQKPPTRPLADLRFRTLIGEARRHPEEARQIICEAAKPMRERLLAYLRSAQKAGSVRRDLDLPPAIDAFTGMLLAGMLRRTALTQFLDYSVDEYVTTVVDLFLRGIATVVPERKRRVS